MTTVPSMFSRLKRGFIRNPIGGLLALVVTVLISVGGVLAAIREIKTAFLPSQPATISTQGTISAGPTQSRDRPEVREPARETRPAVRTPPEPSPAPPQTAPDPATVPDAESDVAIPEAPAPERPEPVKTPSAERVFAGTLDSEAVTISFTRVGDGMLRGALASGRQIHTPEVLFQPDGVLRTLYIVQLSPADREYDFHLAGAQVAKAIAPACSGLLLALPVGSVDIRTKGIGFGKRGGANKVSIPHPLAKPEQGPDGQMYGKVMMPRWTGTRCETHLQSP